MRTVAVATQETVLVGQATTVQQASAAMLDRHVAAAIVVGGRGGVGLLSAEDVTRALAEGRDATSTPVEAVASSDPLVVRLDEPLVDVHQRMRASRCSLAVVVDADGRARGVLEDHEVS